jgi:cell division protein FtsA
VDIGGGTTDIAIFVNGSVVHTSILPLGGNHLTNDVAVGLRTPANEAERIKQKYGCVLTSLVQKEETIEVPSVGGRNPRILSRQILSEILEPRIEEIFNLVHQDIQRGGFEDRIAAGVVLTGGCAVLEGMPELAEQIFNMPVRRGVPKGVGGLVDVVRSPMYATAVGLVMSGARSGLEEKIQAHTERKGIFKMGTKIKDLFSEIF